MSVQRRPRIPDEMTREIDAVRGREPFESWVRNALDEYLRIHCSHRRDGYKVGSTPQATVLTELLCSDLFQLNLKDWDEAAAEARAWVVAELDQQAREDEHDDVE